MSGSKEYILRKPIEIWQDEQGNYCAYLFDDLSDDPGYRTFDKEYLDDNFVVFDREQLEQQLEEQFQRVFEGFVTNKIISQDDLDLCKRDLAEDVLALFLGEEANK